MKRCTICHATYPATFTHCPHDGSLLTEANEWSEGAMIRSKYRILGKVGEGGMATVYKALHVGFDEVCAVKVIKPELASDQSFVKRFGQEAAITRKLQHPNAVRVEDIDQADDGRPFMVMEFIEGESLKDVIRNQAPLPVARVCGIAKQVAAALDAAHKLGMVHRDIKPGNIILTRPAAGAGEVAKVLDFGIAKIKEAHMAAGAATLTRTGTSIGTPAYMSPEQAMGKTGDGLDGRADLYSLGVVMYEMITGELPIQAESEIQMLISQINTAPQPIRTRRPELPEGIGGIVMRCLEKDPARRPASGASLVAQIESFERGVATGTAPDDVPTVATPRPVLPQTASAPARRPSGWVWAAAFLAVIAIAMAIAGGTRYFVSRGKQVASAPPAAPPVVVKEQPLTQAAPAPAPAAPPAPSQPEQIPTPAPTAGEPQIPHPGGDQAINPVDAVRAALDAAHLDPATQKQMQDILRQAGDLMKKGDLEGATAQYKRLAGLRPGLGPTIAALSALANKGNWHGGPDNENFDPFDPDQAGHRGPRGPHRSGELRAEVARYSEAIRENPNVAINHYNLGSALGKLGDSEADMHQQDEALRLDPGLASAHEELGSIHSSKEAWSDAAREYREAIRLKPDLAEAHSGLGNVLGHTGDWKGQLAEEMIATQQDPTLAIAHFRLATALEHEGSSAEALAEYRRAFELEPWDSNYKGNYRRMTKETKSK